jgi:hypothetical protein
MNNSERRQECRLQCAELVHVSRPEGSGRRSLEAVLEDISPLGACVQVDEKIPPGIEIELTARDATLAGVVSYCVFRDFGYFVGIRFLLNPWSTSVFHPLHLIDLRTLTAHSAD